MKIMDQHNVPLCIFVCLFFAAVVNGDPQCPPGYTGLLKYEGNCEKFIQCDHGVTHIQDCGPGTAFNPKISTCDWPYNVPECSKATTQQPYSGEHGNNGGVNIPNSNGNNNYGGNYGSGNGVYGSNQGGHSGHGVQPPNNQYTQNIPYDDYNNHGQEAGHGYQPTNGENTQNKPTDDYSNGHGDGKNSDSYLYPDIDVRFGSTD